MSLKADVLEFVRLLEKGYYSSIMSTSSVASYLKEMTAENGRRNAPVKSVQKISTKKEAPRLVSVTCGFCGRGAHNFKSIAHQRACPYYTIPKQKGAK